MDRMKQSVFISFLFTGLLTLALYAISFLCLPWITSFLQIPPETVLFFTTYMIWILTGLPAVFLYNFLAALLRAIGNSVIPLIFLIISSVLNIVLDIWFIIYLGYGVAGAAIATVIAQYVSALGLVFYRAAFRPDLSVPRRRWHWNSRLFSEMARLSLLTSLQQSIMNFGILLVQGLVNSFGTSVMAAFAAGVKIDTIAYTPLQDFGNSFSTFVAQNYGAGKKDRIQKGIYSAGRLMAVFSIVISLIICLAAPEFISIFIPPESVETIATGTTYLYVEGSCYLGIGILFMLYGYFRAVKKAGMSVILTILSLGTRVVLAYILSTLTPLGPTGIWAAIPIGWALADAYGLYRLRTGEHMI
jgi:putative MATE family efflux protein